MYQGGSLTSWEEHSLKDIQLGKIYKCFPAQKVGQQNYEIGAAFLLKQLIVPQTLLPGDQPLLFRRVPSAQDRASLSVTGQPEVSE